MMLILLPCNIEDTFLVNLNSLAWHFTLNEDKPICVRFFAPSEMHVFLTAVLQQGKGAPWDCL